MTFEILYENYQITIYYCKNDEENEGNTTNRNDSIKINILDMDTMYKYETKINSYEDLDKLPEFMQNLEVISNMICSALEKKSNSVKCSLIKDDGKIIFDMVYQAEFFKIPFKIPVLVEPESDNIIFEKKMQILQVQNNKLERSINDFKKNLQKDVDLLKTQLENVIFLPSCDRPIPILIKELTLNSSMFGNIETQGCSFKLKCTENRDTWHQHILSLAVSLYPVDQKLEMDRDIETDEITEMFPIVIPNSNSVKRTKSLSAMMSRTKSFITGRPNRSQTKTTDICTLQRNMTAQQLLDSWNEDPSQSLMSMYIRLVNTIKLGNEDITDSAVYTLVIRMERDIRDHIEDMVYLMRYDDAMLIDILTICQMEQAQHPTERLLTHSYDNWIEWRKQDVQSDGIQRIVSLKQRNSIHHSMWYKTFALILDGIIVSTRPLKEAKSLNKCWKAIDDIMSDIDYLNNYIDSKFPPNCTTTNIEDTFCDNPSCLLPPYYHVIYFYVEQCFRRMAMILIDKLDSTEIELRDVLTAVSRIKAFMVKMDKLRSDNKMDNGLCSGQTIIAALGRRQDMLIKRYTDNLAVKWLVWVYNVVQIEATKREYFMMDGIPKVHCVQDLFTMFNVLDSRALSTSTKMFDGVYQLIGKTIDMFLVLMEADIHCNGRHFEDEYFCAVINAMGNIIDTLKRYKWKMRWKVSNFSLKNDVIFTKEETNWIDVDFESRIRRFRNWTKQTAVLLVNNIVEDVLRSNVFDVLFATQYFKKEKGFDVTIMVKTLKEYLQDFSVWIEEEWVVQKVRLSVMEIICDEYIRALIRESPSEGISSMANHIYIDVEILNAYFGDKSVFPDEMFQEAWKAKYRYLESIHEGLVTEDELIFMIYSKRLKEDDLYGRRLLQMIEEKRKLFRIANLYNLMMFFMGYFWWESSETKIPADLIV